MKLKTLKQMDLIDMKNKKGYTEEVVRIDELKEEAIKWVKMIDNPLTDKEVALKLGLYNMCKTQEEVQNCLFGARRLLIIQNNITEENLKKEVGK